LVQCQIAAGFGLFDLALNQRRIGGTGTAVVLVIAFALLALAAVL